MKIVKSIFVLLISFGTLLAQNIEYQLDSILQSDFDKEVGPGYAIQIDQNGESIFKRSVGFANLELDVPMTNDHIFRIGSITKQFTAAAILKLEEEEKLKLSDPIEKFIQDYPTKGKTINIEHLLTHTSGIKSYTGLKKWDAEERKKDFTVLELIDYFKNEPMDFDPGEKFRYNNSGYILLGHIIEVVSGKTYAEFLEEEFFKPIGMHNSSYGEPSRLIKNRASGYSQSPTGEIINAPFLSMTQPYAAGSILSTTEDLSKWYHAIFSDKVISKANRERAHSSYKLKNGKETGYGYGWSLLNYKGVEIIQHGGGINGFSTASAFIPSKNTFVTVLANCNCLSPDKLLQKLGTTAIGMPMEGTKRIDVPLDQLEQYVGNYKLSPALTINISVKKDKLMLQATGQPSFELVPIDKHSFYIEEVEAKIVFNLENKEVESLTLHQGGVHKAPKINK